MSFSIKWGMYKRNEHFINEEGFDAFQESPSPVNKIPKACSFSFPDNTTQVLFLFLFFYKNLYHPLYDNCKNEDVI